LLKAIETYKFCIEKLDTLLRLLENDAIDNMDKLWELRDIIDVFEENPGEIDYF